MFTAVKPKVARKGLIDLLIFIVTGTQSEAGFAFVPKEEADKIVKAEPTFLTLDPAVVNEGGLIKAVATQVAIDAVAQSKTEAATEPVTPVVPEPMNFDTGYEELPEIQRGGIKSDSYPFATLGAPKLVEGGKPQCAFFFVPATNSNPNPAKRLASTVASATKRYAATDKREFAVRKIVDAEKKVLGARVYRTK